MRADPDDVSRMIELNRQCVEDIDPESCELWDGAFHRQIAVAARNRMLLSLFDILNRVRQDPAWQRTREMARDNAGSRDAVIHHRARVIAAIEGRDPAAAGQA